MTVEAGDYYVPRREFDQLAARVELIDSQGSRGVGVIQYQLTALGRDYTDQKLEIGQVRTLIENHEKDHQRAADRQASERRNTRRWTIGLAAAIVVPLYPLLLDLLLHLH